VIIAVSPWIGMLAGRELSCLPIIDPYRHFDIGFPEFYTGSLLFLISDTERY
jgi:hypothetical protein